MGIEKNEIVAVLTGFSQRSCSCSIFIFTFQKNILYIHTYMHYLIQSRNTGHVLFISLMVLDINVGLELGAGKLDGVPVD